MTDIDFPFKKDPEPAPQNYAHRWLYSVVPAYDKEATIFLSGFCPNCSRVFSVEIPRGVAGAYRETATIVPRWGCVGELV